MEELKTASLWLDLSHTLAAPLLRRTVYPWEALDELGTFILTLIETLPEDRYEAPSPGVRIARSAKIAPGVTICPPCVIGEQSELRPGSFLRGNVLVGDGVTVGNSVELKNCVLFDGVQVPHFNYVGDSVLGYRSHLGAGAVTSNVKSDKSDVTVRVGDLSFPTGRHKLGAMLGDFVEVGCNSVLNPGTVVGCHTNIYPLSSVRGYLPAHSIFKGAAGLFPKRGEPFKTSD